MKTQLLQKLICNVRYFKYKTNNFNYKMSFPKVIYFCNKTLDKMQIYADNWKKLNPEYEIKLYDNSMCEEFIFNNFGELHRDVFNFIKDGPIKADFWRLCILYKNGGVYSDIDNEPLVSISSFLKDNIDFLTCSSYWDAMQYTFNPNFIIANKGEEILKNCIDWYIYKYINKHTYSYWGWSIMTAFKDTLHLGNNYKKEDGIYSLNEKKIQILKECPGKHHYDAHNLYEGIRIFNNRYSEWNADTHSFRE